MQRSLVRRTIQIGPVLFLLVFVAPSDCDAQEKATNSPQAILGFDFNKDGFRGKSFRGTQPNADFPLATFSGTPVFEKTAPFALTLKGNSKSRHRALINPAQKAGTLPAEALSVEAWVQVEKPLEWGGLVGCLQDNGSFERGWLLGYRHTQFCFAIATEKSGRLTYLNAPRQFEPGFWYHLVGTWDGTHQRIYVDGKLAAESKSQSGKIHYAPAAPFVVGAYEDENEYHPLTGKIASVRVWDNGLDPKEIQKRFEKSNSRFPDSVAVRPIVADWPTYNRDNQRTGISAESVTVPLHKQWSFQVRNPPSPAWPRPALQDFWHKKFNLQPRVIYDRAAHVVSVGERVFFGSSADDCVYCLNAESGRVEWTFSTEGPVRLAPTVDKDRVLFGSDDGHVYCVQAENGELLWKHRAGPNDRRIPGNERIISAWPVRTGVLVEDNVAFFCAGLFPKQGVYQVALNATTGKRLDSAKIDVAAQGYLERRGGRMFTPTGRDPAGSFVRQLRRRGKGVGKEVANIPERFQFGFIGAEGIRFGGGDNEVAAFDAKTGEQLWNRSVNGKAWSLAYAGGRLLVSTDAGEVSCFSAQKPSAANHVVQKTKTLPKPTDAVLDRAKNAIPTQLKKGYCLVVGGTDFEFLRALCSESELQIVTTVDDAATSDSLRRKIADAGLAGRLTVHRLSKSKRLPYTDYLFNLVITANTQFDNKKQADAFRADCRRVLRPYGGVFAEFDRADSSKPATTFVRPALKGAGSWGHMYANAANTVCSDDSIVSGDLQLQWFGRPGPMQMLDRHHRTIAPVWANGRLFIPGNNRVIGADAYNGTQLWNVEIPNSRRIGAYRDSSYLVADSQNVYVAAAGKCLVLDALKGEEKRQLKVPPTVDGSPREWGFLSVVGRQVFGTTAKPGGIRRDYGLNAINEGTFWDFRPLVCSDSFFAQSADGKQSWSYPATDGMLINSTFTIGPKNVYFVESANPKTMDVPNGRIIPKDLASQGTRLVALNRQDGSVAWSVVPELKKVQHNVFTAMSDGLVVVVGSYNSGKDKKKDSVMYDVRVFRAANGELVWKKTQRQNLKIGGDHGEQDHHPVIVDDTLYCEPYAYNLKTGEEIKWAWDPAHRRGCGTISASASTFFFRQSNPTMFDLNTNTYDKVTSSTRPGCWINMIPAGGLLLIPEASSGCTCNYAIQTSLAFLPGKTP